MLPVTPQASSIKTSSPDHASTPEDEGKLTPMLIQYVGEKKKHPDCLLFFRLGDFYELFFEDAITAAEVLQITLTHRGVIDGKPVPMCGVPFHAYEHYLKKLIEKGFRVALCEQTETPEDRQKTGGKGPLMREVVRVVTPGTVVEETLLDAKAHNYLLSLAYIKGGGLSCACIDLSTSTCFIETLDTDNVMSLMARFNAAEILLPETLFAEQFDQLRQHRKRLIPLPSGRYDAINAKKRLLETYNIKTLDGLEDLNDGDFSAMAALVDYIGLTQKGTIGPLPLPKKKRPGTFLVIDSDTQLNLEIFLSTKRTREGSLLGCLDKAVTSAGARLLATRLSTPLLDKDVLNHRLDHIQFLKENSTLTQSMRQALAMKNIDIARSLSRVLYKKAGPRDLGHVRDGLSLMQNVKEILSLHQDYPLRLPTLPELLLETLNRALGSTLPLLAREGQFIADGYHEKLDQLKDINKKAAIYLDALQEKYRHLTGIATLKIKNNNILGYFLECPPSQQNKIPEAFIHRQSLASALRYTTPELSKLAERIDSAEAEALQIELELFEELSERVAEHQNQVLEISQFLAEIDLATTMAYLAREKGYSRPILYDHTHMAIQRGRHPVLDSSDFIPNDIQFDDAQRFFLITGPNMAGKSTYLRQTALITLMAQCGFFVPAKRAEIGLCDRIFSRIGAGDDLASGRSTFMVEMVETATILNQATHKSLVILDELGRGTSTYDGLSLAWAVTEHLAREVRCRTLFATHYFELTSLEASLPHLHNLQLTTKEHKDSIIFLHHVSRGAANRSYGLHVAALSGVPTHIINRAEEILGRLQKEAFPLISPLQESNLPAATRNVKQECPITAEILKSLKEMDINSLTPVKALNMLHDLCEKVDGIR